MDSKNLIQVKTTVTQISTIIDNLQSPQSSLIDFDLSLEKTRQLYEQLTDLKLEKLSNKETSIKTESIKIEKEKIEEKDLSNQIDQETLKYIEEKEQIDKKIVKTQNTQENKPVTEIKSEKTNINIKEPIEIIEQTKPITNTEAIKEPQSNQNSNTIADNFEEKTSLNDILANIKNDDDFATQLQNSPIKNLKTAISLNDKIWFTRELFDGHNEKYISTLEKLNNANSLENAVEIANTFNWNKEDSSTKRFLELIYRRFV